MTTVWEKPGLPLPSCLTPGRKNYPALQAPSTRECKTTARVCVLYVALLTGSLAFKDFSFLMGGGKGRRRERKSQREGVGIEREQDKGRRRNKY